MSTLLLIDGNSIMNRAFYGIKSLSTKSGIPTNAIHGFIKILLKLKNDINPSAIAVAFDLPSPTFRNIKFKDYKGNRKSMPEDLIPQFPIIKNILSYMGISIIEKEGFEADDIIGTLSHNCKAQSYKCVISTGDRDSFQLINDNVSVSFASNKETIIYDTSKIKEIYNILPIQLIEVKALNGDKSDNIPGVKGIGEKTALKLIQDFDNIDNIYDNIDNLDINPRIKKLLLEEKEIAFISKELGTIYTNCPIDTNISNYNIKEIDNQKLFNKLTELEMFKTIENLNLKRTNQNNQNKIKLTIINDPKIDDAVLYIKKSEYIDFLISYNDNNIKNIKFNINNNTILIFNSNFSDIFEKIIIPSKSKKRCFDSKSMFLYLMNNKINYNFNIDFDLILSAYLSDPSAKNYNLETLLDKHICYTCFDIEDEHKDIAYFSNLCDILEEELSNKNMYDLLKDIEIPLSKILANMEFKGFEIDKKGVEEFSKYLQKNIEKTKNQIFELAGESFNPNSTQHLANILYNKLNLKPKKKIKSGYSTDQETLETLINEHPIIDKIIQYRKLTKLNSTYVIGFINLVKNGRIHSIFKQTETRTGRISSIEPNLQNIPIRTELGRQIRKFFIAKPGYVLLDADYSQIELRILADISNDQNMIEDFNNGLDIHTATAAKVFNLNIDNVPLVIRTRAKAINFGISYGISAFSLAKDINVSVKDAQDYIDGYFKTYSGVKKYLDNTVSKAYKVGFVATMFNRIRELPEIKSSNKNIRMFGERIAMNTPIQGSAADIIKIAMIKVYNRIINENIDANLILQVHDELIVEVNKKHIGIAKEILKSEMENSVKLKVPLIVDIKVGDSWYDAKE